ncbi:MAG: ABC transporter ATP-binding protein/permease [Pirellulales bacterium]
MISVSDLRKAYGSNVAVDGVSFAIPAGETFGLLGPNGAGKTTTMHMLAGALKPDGGRIEIAGAADPTKARLRRTIGIAPQATALYEDLTGTENVRFFGALYGLAGNSLREHVAKALEFVGLADRGKDLVSTYSGGMKRRLNIAAAVVADPQVILFDEPTVGVDPQSRNSMFDNIEQLKRSGKTILYTTHYMEEAQRLCDRVAVTRGEILAGKGLACFLACAIISAFLLALGWLVFGVRVLDPVKLAVAIAASSACFVGLMMFTSVLGRTERAVAGSVWAILMPLAMLGGSMVPQIAMPRWMQTAGSVSPVKWTIRSFEGAIWRDLPWSEMLAASGILVAMGAVFYAIGLTILLKYDA